MSDLGQWPNQRQNVSEIQQAPKQAAWSEGALLDQGCRQQERWRKHDELVDSEMWRNQHRGKLQRRVPGLW